MSKAVFLFVSFLFLAVSSFADPNVENPWMRAEMEGRVKPSGVSVPTRGGRLVIPGAPNASSQKGGTLKKAKRQVALPEDTVQ